MSEAKQRTAPIGEMTLKNVRLSFCERLFEAKVVKGGKKANYGCNLLIDTSTEAGRKLDAAILAKIEAVKKEKWNDNIPKLKANLIAYRDGDEEDWEGYAGHWYISANNANKIQVVDRNPAISLTKEDGKVFAGCRVNACVRFWAQDDDEYGKRINASIESIQFVADDGIRYGAKPVDPKSVFEEMPDDEDSEGDDDLY